MSIITIIASSVGTDEYRFTESYDVCVSEGDIFHWFASSKNLFDFLSLWVIRFNVDCVFQ